MAESEPGWNFLSNHSHVLVCIATDGDVRLRDIAARVGITERSAQRIINQLREAGILLASRCGRRNHYLINVDGPLRHPLEAHCSVGSVLAAVLGRKSVNALRRQFKLELSALDASH